MNTVTAAPAPTRDEREREARDVSRGIVLGIVGGTTVWAIFGVVLALAGVFS